MNRDVVLFDLDGTLSESEPGIVGSLVTALGAVGVAVPAPEVLRLAIGPPFDTGLVDLGVPPEHVAAVIAAYRSVYEVTGLFDTRMYDGVPEMLDALRACGVTLAIATSKPQPTAERVLDHLGLAAHFTVVAGATHDNTRRSKADVIGHALERLGIDAGPAVVMVGDRHHDIEGAAAHGIDTIAVAWGYGSADEHGRAGAWARAERPDDVVGLVTGDVETSFARSLHSVERGAQPLA